MGVFQFCLGVSSMVFRELLEFLKILLHRGALHECLIFDGVHAVRDGWKASLMWNRKTYIAPTRATRTLAAEDLAEIRAACSVFPLNIEGYCFVVDVGAHGDA